MAKRQGKRTTVLENGVYISSFSSAVGPKEAEGPLSKYFDKTFQDEFLGQNSFEKAESQLQKISVSTTLKKADLSPTDVDMIFAGDLLNQCIGSAYGLRELGIPFVGLYGACSTMALSTIMASTAVESGAADKAIAVTSSHFCSSERQFRFPLEYGGQRPPTAQWTVTGSGSVLLSRSLKGIKVNAYTVGKIVDLDVTDMNNMGAAMAPDDVKIRPYPTHEGMVFFYTQIQYSRGFRALFNKFSRSKKQRKTGRKTNLPSITFSQKKEVKMSFLKFLTDKYGCNKPILSNEIEYEDYSKQQVYKELSQLCKSKKIVRLERGVYFIPKKTKFGTMIFNPMKAIEKKYICEDENVFGYYSGAYLRFQLGLSKLKPNTIDIYTNNETQKTHRIKIANQNLLLRKPRTKIDKHNAPVLCFLELMNGVDVETLDEYKRKLISDYINENRITQKQITKYIPYFPDKTCRNLIESEVIYRVPQ